MNTFLLTAHIITAILFIGPVTVASSMFPRFAKQAPQPSEGVAADPAAQSNASSTAVLRVLHSITRVYGALGLLVPILGFLLAYNRGILGEGWVVISTVLSAVTALLLALIVYPQQRALMADIGNSGLLQKLRISSGIFALLWVIITVLMVIRPTLF